MKGNAFVLMLVIAALAIGAGVPYYQHGRPSVATLQYIEGSRYFYTDGTSVYFKKSVMSGWKEIPAFSPDGTPGEGTFRVTDTATSSVLVAGADLATLVVEDTRATTPLNSKPFMLETKAHDKGQRYTIAEERWGCLGDTVGCPGDVTLVTSSYNGPTATISSESLLPGAGARTISGTITSDDKSATLLVGSGEAVADYPLDAEGGNWSIRTDSRGVPAFVPGEYQVRVIAAYEGEMITIARGVLIVR